MKELDTIITTDYLDIEDIPPGAKGTIVHVYNDTTYEVEFASPYTRIITVHTSQIKPNEQ